MVDIEEVHREAAAARAQGSKVRELARGQGRGRKEEGRERRMEDFGELARLRERRTVFAGFPCAKPRFAVREVELRRDAGHVEPRPDASRP